MNIKLTNGGFVAGPADQLGPGALSWLDRFRGRVRAWGPWRALHWQVKHLLARFLGLRVHYVRIGADRADLRDPAPPQVPSGYVTKLGRKEDFVPFLGRVPRLDAAFLERAFRRDDECSLTLYEGELVSFSFSTRQRARVTDQLDVLVPPGFRYAYKSWTHPEHRRRNLSNMGRWLRATQARRPFAERSIWYVETHNYASLLHGVRHPNEWSIKMGYVGWITLFGRQIPFTSRKAKQLGFEFVRNDDHRRRLSAR